VLASVCASVAWISTPRLAAAQPSDIDRAALVDLYAATDGRSWVDDANWNMPSVPFCAWFGTTCDSNGTRETHMCVCLRPAATAAAPVPMQCVHTYACCVRFCRSALWNDLLAGIIPQTIVHLTALTIL
jgi:hypothetical protein